jgi:hypothetical protein
VRPVACSGGRQLLAKARKDHASGKKIIRIAHAAGNGFALDPATLATRLSEEAILCLEAAKSEGKRTDAADKQSETARSWHDDWAISIEQGLKALTRP